MLGASRLSVDGVNGSYLLFIDGVPRVLVDPANGTFERLLRGLDPQSIEQVLLTNLSIERTGDLPSFVRYRSGHGRTTALTGPDGSPGTADFIDLLFGGDGAWSYVNDISGFKLNVRETPSSIAELAVFSIPVEPVLEELSVSLYGVAVPDGRLPAVAFRVECGDESVVFAGDLTHSTASFVALAKRCSLLVHAGSVPRAGIDELAQRCGAKAVLVESKQPT